VNTNTFLNALIGVGIVAVLALGYLLGVSPTLEQAAAAQAQADSIKTANDASDVRLASLKKQFDEIGLLNTELAELLESIPYDADIPGFLAEINALCAQTGVTLTSLSVNDALAYISPTAAADAAAAQAAADAAAASDDPPAAVTPTTPVAEGSRLVAVPVKVVVSGQYSNVMSFAGALQKGSRLMLVTNLALTGSATDTSFSGALTGNIYALPLPEGVPTPDLGDEVAPTPAPTQTPTPTETEAIEPEATPSGTPTP